MTAPFLRFSPDKEGLALALVLRYIAELVQGRTRL